MFSTDPRTKFLPRITANGKWAFESYCERGKFIVLERTVSANTTEVTLKLDSPKNNSELFDQISPFPGTFAYKPSMIEPERCYMAFDGFGNHCGNLMCELDTSHMSTIIGYIETVSETNCQHSQRKFAKMEL